MSQAPSTGSMRQFILYWAGFLIVVGSLVAILLSISGVLVDALSYRCWYPILSPLLGINEPPQPSQIPNMPFYCSNPAIAVVRFVFNFLASLVSGGAGAYMMWSGKKN